MDAASRGPLCGTDMDVKRASSIPPQPTGSWMRVLSDIGRDELFDGGLMRLDFVSSPPLITTLVGIGDTDEEVNNAPSTPPQPTGSWATVLVGIVVGVSDEPDNASLRIDAACADSAKAAPVDDVGEDDSLRVWAMVTRILSVTPGRPEDSWS